MKDNNGLSASEAGKWDHDWECGTSEVLWYANHREGLRYVHPQLAARPHHGCGHREKAIQLLSDALPRWELWSIKARVQKNLNLLTLPGRSATVLPANLRGKPVLFFLWAHWCSDCTGQAPILARLHKRFPELAMIAPTRRIGQVDDNDHASVQQEDAQIEKVWKESYMGLGDVPHPVEPATQMVHGVSSTPTLVLVDRTGGREALLSVSHERGRVGPVHYPHALPLRSARSARHGHHKYRKSV